MVVVLATSGCNRARTPENLGAVEIRGQNGTAQTPAPTNSATDTATTFGERYDPNAEMDISTNSLKAWRTAVSHSKQGTMPDAEWKTKRAADEKSAMDQLKELQDRHPNSSTVRFMMGQVKEHFGKHDEAVKEFRASMENNTNNGMYLFKLAEAESKAGNHDEAIKQYRKLIQHNANFAPAELGLARSLLKKDPKNAEAVELLKKIVAAEPDNKEAKALLSSSTGAKP